jgi:hypothetical protein
VLRKDREEEQSPYSGVERQLLNTFYSGLYISAKELLDLGRESGVDNIALKSRELLLKEIFSQSHKNGNVAEVMRRLRLLVDKRVAEYQSLFQKYPNSRGVILPLLQKAHGTKRVLV